MAFEYFGLQTVTVTFTFLIQREIFIFPRRVFPALGVCFVLVRPFPTKTPLWNLFWPKTDARHNP